MKNKYFPFYLFSISVFLILISPNMFSDGMFMDGLLYAVISKNLANGQGSFWNLYLTSSFPYPFYGHPPLAFGMQSIFFRILGDGIITERLYSFTTFIVTGIIIILIWKKTIIKDAHITAWLPLLFWIIIPLVFWAAPNNMLENTMMIFTSLSVLFILNSLTGKRLIYLIFSGFSLFCEFLVKGFVGLFPASLIFWLFIFKPGFGIKRFFIDITLLITSALIPLLFIFILTPESIIYLHAYFNEQIIHSFGVVKTVENRFYILYRLLRELLPPVIGVFIVFFITRKHKLKNLNIKCFFIFLSLGLSGVVPVMISLKQSGFYIIPAFPIFSIALALIIEPRVKFLLSKINLSSWKYAVFKLCSIILFLISITLITINANTIGRDIDKIKDVYSVIEVVEKNSVISIEPNIRTDWSLHGYFARYGNISLAHGMPYSNKYVLTKKYQTDNKPPENYKKVPLELNLFILYEKKDD